MADTYDYEKDTRLPCDFPVDGEVDINDFGPDGKYKDCKVDWSKESSRLGGKEIHFDLDYSEKETIKKEVKEEMLPTKINPDLITAPTIID